MCAVTVRASASHPAAKESAIAAPKAGASRARRVSQARHRRHGYRKRRRRRDAASCPGARRGLGGAAERRDVLAIVAADRREKCPSRRPARWLRRRRQRRRSRPSTPPSASMSMSRPAASAFTARTLSSMAGISVWPPKPGLTVMTMTRSSRSSTCSIALAGVAGLMRDAGALAERADRLQRAVEMRPRLGMHGDRVGAGGGEGLRDRDRRARSSDARRRAFSCGPAGPR